MCAGSICMLKSTKKYYLNDNLLLLVCLLSNVILCTAMGAVMHKPLETKARAAADNTPTLSLSLSIAIRLVCCYPTHVLYREVE